MQTNMNRPPFKVEERCGALARQRVATENQWDQISPAGCATDLHRHDTGIQPVQKYGGIRIASEVLADQRAIRCERSWSGTGRVMGVTMAIYALLSGLKVRSSQLQV
jgi:hypothetical protein